jgi:hypothetical protein
VVRQKPRVQRRFWLEKELLRRLEHEAKNNNRPLTVEFAERLRLSFERQDWQEDREKWFIALHAAVEGNLEVAVRFFREMKPKASTLPEAIQQTNDAIERESQKDLMSDLHRK